LDVNVDYKFKMNVNFYIQWISDFI